MSQNFSRLICIIIPSGGNNRHGRSTNNNLPTQGVCSPSTCSLHQRTRKLLPDSETICQNKSWVRSWKYVRLGTLDPPSAANSSSTHQWLLKSCWQHLNPHMWSPQKEKQTLLRHMTDCERKHGTSAMEVVFFFLHVKNMKPASNQTFIPDRQWTGTVGQGVGSVTPQRQKEQNRECRTTKSVSSLNIRKSKKKEAWKHFTTHLWDRSMKCNTWNYAESNSNTPRVSGRWGEGSIFETTKEIQVMPACF